MENLAGLVEVRNIRKVLICPKKKAQYYFGRTVCVKKSQTVIRHDLVAITTWYSKVWHANEFWVVLGKIAGGKVIEKHS